MSEDLADVPLEAKYLALRGKSRGLDRLRQLTDIEALWASGITPQLLDALPALPKLRALNLYQVGRADLAAVGRIATLEHLLIGWANHLTDISWLEQLPRLRTLVLEDAQRLNLETLPRLEGLEALSLGGGVWKVLKLPSLDALRRLPALKYLSLTSITVHDGSLHPIGELRALRSLHTANIFSLEESAWLATRHPSIESPVLRPLFAEAGNDVRGNPVIPCSICGAAKVMPTMRRAPLWCPRCDVTHVRKHVAKWEMARASAMPRVP